MEYIFEPLLKVAQNSYKVRENIVSVVLYPGHLLSMFFGSLFLLLLTCFNYMNITIVSAARRFKEIGVRKVIGSNKTNLITQFLGENLLLCCIALFIGITLAELIFAPGFHNFFHVFNFKVDLLGNPGLLVFLLVMLLVTGLGAGIYQAFYISAFHPVNIFRQKQKISGNNFLTKVLLTLQFIFSIITVTNGILLIQNNKYQRNRDWGYNQKQRIVVPVDGKSQFTIVRNAIKQHSDVLSTAGSRHHIGGYMGRVGIEILEKKSGRRSSLILLTWAFIKTVYSMNTIRLWQEPPKVLPPLL
jgi:putative ABC transport system permease protein